MSYVKKPIEFLDWILHSVSMGGNILVNFGPTPQGDSRPEEREPAEYHGRWMAANGEAVYGCDDAGWEKTGLGVLYEKGDRIYMTVFNKPMGKILKVATPPGVKPVSARLLIDGKRVVPCGMIETTRDQYHIMPGEDTPDQPFVIMPECESGKDSGKRYQKP